MKDLTKCVSKNPVYKIWENMKARCLNKNNPFYYRYGGRGITVCDEWINDSNAFIDWALSNGYKKGLYFDKIDNDSGYSPDNCRFVDSVTNTRNRSLTARPTSGYYGVYFHKRKNRYIASVTVDKQTKYLGCFKNKIDCAVVRDSYIINNELKFNLNFKPGFSEIK